MGVITVCKQQVVRIIEDVYWDMGGMSVLAFKEGDIIIGTAHYDEHGDIISFVGESTTYRGVIDYLPIDCFLTLDEYYHIRNKLQQAHIIYDEEMLDHIIAAMEVVRDSQMS